MQKIILIVILMFSINKLGGQSVIIKDSAADTLMIVNDEGSVKSSITIPSSGSAPTTTTSKLYNENGTLKWNGSSLSTSGADGHSLDADDGDPTDAVYVEDSGDVGIGTITPQGALEITSTTGGLIVPRMATGNRDLLPNVAGTIIYNTTTGVFNFNESGSWVTKLNE